MDSGLYEHRAVKTDLMDYQPVIDRLQVLKTLRILHAAMGCCTESGELMDAVKKHILYGKPIDDVNLQEEAGDMFWYCALLADAVGFSFEDTFEKNIAKLQARYPNRFNEKDALVRNLDKERQILEGK
jgi:NTP pyrophosphatase (non-canonical NTP hydrolase)